MLWRARSWVILAAVAILLAVKVGEQLYRWLAYRDERVQLAALAMELDTVGLSVMTTQLAAESLGTFVKGVDAELDGERRRIARAEERAASGTLTHPEYSRYRAGVRRYNAEVARRNAAFEEWKAVVARNHLAVRRFNLVADSMRALAKRMGEPYYAVPTPAQIAGRHGLSPPGDSARR